MEEPADLRTFPEPPSYIQMTQRFSVRSHRASKRMSLRSNKSRRTGNTRQPSPLKPATSSNNNSTEQRLARPPQAKRPPPIRVHTEPVPKILDSWLASPSSTLVDSKTASPATEKGVARPEMALVRKLSDGSNCMTPTKREFEALPQVVTIKRSTSKRITIAARTLDDDKNLYASPILARELRWSGSCSDLPPTPKLALERCPTTDERPSQLRVEVKDSEAGPKKLSTDSARRIAASQSTPNLKKGRFLPSLSRGSSQRSSQRRVLTRPPPKA
ncbi:hypothetical protein K461DRAFT_2245 [Myriangium duriaei CBS 260.36]|uniref:Uncharacterized protein n=1 Tax=Myriangium duriaei CBS 260.36 TaxID=1168546 RepID=A0A9P4JD58_9PEZI|nr:hypothetical protein K461DRAFT_2245 [Myriangium duriaei CBS 260.36]